MTEPPHPDHRREPGIIDPDVDLHDPTQRGETRPREWDILLAIAVGGVVGSEARYGLGLAVAHTGRQFPWSTVLINASGCLLIGVLMVCLLELRPAHRLARPFLGVGVLGGYTTFSTFAVDVQRLLVGHRVAVALGYVAASVVFCLLAVTVGTALTRWLGPPIMGRRATGPER
jgi:CrcB protein